MSVVQEGILGLSAGAAAGGTAGGIAVRPVKNVEIFDFGRPTTLTREHSRVLELAMETFARQWGTHLSARVRVKSLIASTTVIMQTYDEYAASLPSTTAMVLCALEGNSAQAVIQFPTAAGLGLVVQMLGGDGGQRLPHRKFTQIEQALVMALMDDALENLRYSLDSLLSVPISLAGIQYNAQFAQAAGPLDLMIVSAFKITVAGVTAPATVAIPAEILLPHLGAANPVDSPEHSRERILEQLVHVPVDVSLQLTPTTVRPSTILNLAVGDLIELPHPKDRPVDVAVDGLPLAHAALGSKGSRLAGVIVTTEENPR
ncbi:flagellar motor switch protein FliM [Arthrobacter terrae]|uniref:flagellar motor switch protein FliM n=1 Tax=Arthrobacter terrae TaxID=2935737 RepID=UPI0028A5EB33|nr:flagellar motor switch protein FliM [Arthrobacter terrae]